MIKNSFIALYNRDLNRLYKEIEAYTDEAVLWQRVEGISNPAGNLCLHLMGNLNEYIGRQLGNFNYQRNRPNEFSATNVSQKDLLTMVRDTQKVVEMSLKSLNDADLSATYPEDVLGYEMNVHYFLVHLNGHLNWHLGQINYHRRILSTPSV